VPRNAIFLVFLAQFVVLLQNLAVWALKPLRPNAFTDSWPTVIEAVPSVNSPFQTEEHRAVGQSDGHLIVPIDDGGGERDGRPYCVVTQGGAGNKRKTTG
jgi:hypothetical protein